MEAAKAFKEKNTLAEDFGFVAITRKFHRADGKTETNLDVQIIASGNERIKEAVCSDLETVKAALGSDIVPKERLTFYKTKEIPYGDKCAGCEKQLGKTEQYVAIEL